MKNEALIIVDMQKAFLEKGAAIEVPDGKRIIPNIKKAINLFRKNNLPVIWTKVNIEYLRNTQYSELFPDHYKKSPHVLNKNSLDYEIADEIKNDILTKDFIVEKDCYSAFLYTNLDLILKSYLKVDTLFFAGVSTNVCVESTIRDAFQLGYYCTMISDCTATFSEEYQQLSEEIISYVFGKVIKLSQLEEKL